MTKLEKLVAARNERISRADKVRAEIDAIEQRIEENTAKGEEAAAAGDAAAYTAAKNAIRDDMDLVYVKRQHAETLTTAILEEDARAAWEEYINKSGKDLKKLKADFEEKKKAFVAAYVAMMELYKQQLATREQLYTFTGGEDKPSIFGQIWNGDNDFSAFPITERLTFNEYGGINVFLSEAGLIDEKRAGEIYIMTNYQHTKK